MDLANQTPFVPQGVPPFVPQGVPPISKSIDLIVLKARRPHCLAVLCCTLLFPAGLLSVAAAVENVCQ